MINFEEKLKIITNLDANFLISEEEKLNLQENIETATIRLNLINEKIQNKEYFTPSQLSKINKFLNSIIEKISLIGKQIND